MAVEMTIIMIQIGTLRSQSLFQFIQINDQCVFCTPSLPILAIIRCNRLDSNLANLGATVEVE